MAIRTGKKVKGTFVTLEEGGTLSIEEREMHREADW